ncbi:MAG: NADH-quinone oxidoreductase subunit G, partial [Gammaproteobacteria bacterium]
FAETAGTFINCEGRWQGFNGAAEPPGEARPAWKVLRVLGSLLGLSGFEQQSAGEVLAELEELAAGLQPDNDGCWSVPQAREEQAGVGLITELPMFSIDGLVRRSAPLQAMPTAATGEAFVAASLAMKMGLADGERVRISTGQASAILPARIDERLPRGCVLLQSGHAATSALDLSGTTLRIERETER